MRARLIVLAVVSGLIAVSADAQTYTVDSLSSWTLGTVAAAASGTTVFLSTTSAAVSTISGSGQWVKGPVAIEEIGIRCVDSGSNLCSNGANTARIQIGRIANNTGRAQTMTALGLYTNTGTVGSGTNQGNSNVDVQLSGWTASNQVLIFELHCYWPISGDDGAGSLGTASTQYFVYVNKYPTTPTSGMNGTITANVIHSLTISKASDLNFGSLIAPASGNATLSVDSSGNRTTTNGTGAITLLPSSPTAARWNVTGNPGSTFSLTVPSSFSMTGPGSAIAVTINPSTANGTQTISAGGTMTYSAGGSFTIASTQANGAYSGSFTMTVAYN